MIDVQYSFDLKEWKVILYAEYAKDDKVLGWFDTLEEAQEFMKEWTE